MIEHIPRFHGVFRLIGYDHGFTVYDSGPIHNLVVNTGKTLILQRLFGLPAGNVPAAIAGVGIGTDSTAPAVGQTKLNPVVAGSVYIQAPDAGTSISGLTCNIQATIGTGNGNFTIAEAGLLNGTINGTSILLDRVAISPAFTKSSSITLVVSCAFTQT